jgi:hypothetical protein
VRQLMFVERGRVDWADVPAPSLGDENSVLVRPLAVARCDLDLRMVQFRFSPGWFPPRSHWWAKDRDRPGIP